MIMEVKLIQGDCLEKMQDIPDGSIDLVLADPPYGMDYQSERRTDKTQWKPKIKNDKRPFVWWIQAAADRLRDGGCAIVFCRYDSWSDFSWACELAGLKVKGQLVWDKMSNGTGDLKGSPGNRHEIAIFATKGRFLFHGKRPQSLGAFPRISPARLIHPNEKPVALMDWIIGHYCPPNGVVLDPFMGSCPSGLSCLNLDRCFIGIELDKTYFDIASKRIHETQSIAA